MGRREGGVGVVPSLLSLTLDALTRRTGNGGASSSTGGSFWGGESRAPDAIPIQPLPLHADVKLKCIESLRAGGILADEALLRLTDVGYLHLNLASCRLLSGDSLSHLAALCPSLTALDLSWCVQLRDDDLLDENERLVLPPSLRALSLRGCFRLERVPAALQHHHHQLTAVRLDCLPSFEGARLRAAAPPPSRLTILEGSASSASHADLSALSRSSWRGTLRVLLLRDASELDDLHVRTLLRACPVLEHVELRGGDAQRLRASFLLAGAASASLQVLRLDGPMIGACDAAAEGPAATAAQAAAQATAQLMPTAWTTTSAGQALSHLAESGAAVAPALSALTRALATARTASSHPAFPRLHSLQLAGAEQLRLAPAAYYRHVLSLTPSLRVLDLAPQRALAAGDGGLISNAMPHLRVLRLARTRLGTGLAAEIVEHCSALESLRLYRCRGFDAAFTAALRALPTWHTLELAECVCADDELALVHSVLPLSVALRVETRAGGRGVHAATSENARAAHRRELGRVRSWLPAAMREDAAAAALWTEDLTHADDEGEADNEAQPTAPQTPPHAQARSVANL